MLASSESTHLGYVSQDQNDSSSEYQEFGINGMFSNNYSKYYYKNIADSFRLF